MQRSSAEFMALGTMLVITGVVSGAAVLPLIPAIGVAVLGGYLLRNRRRPVPVPVRVRTGR